MPTIEHSGITDPNIHEPKGVATASAGKVYVASGSGSGTWKKITQTEIDSGAALQGYIAVADGTGGTKFTSTPHGFISFINIATPYSLTFPSAYAKVNPTTTAGGSPSSFTEGTNARITYTGTTVQDCKLVVNISASQSSGGNRDLRFMVYKNGSSVASSEIISTSISGNKICISISANIVFSPNDYFEVYAKNDGANGDILVHTLNMFVQGLHEA